MTLRRATADDLDALVALQHAAYAKNRILLGVEPIPLQADYADILATMEVWLAFEDAGLCGALIVQAHSDHLLIWSIATDPAQQPHGLGGKLLAAAEDRAASLGLTTLRLYTGTRLDHLVKWYGRHGYAVDHIEQRPDRSITHMLKSLNR